MRILVDSDACPMKDEIERLAAKRSIEVVHVSSLAALRRSGAGVRVVFVETGPDAADDWIEGECGPGDLVITQDIPLASRAIKRGAAALGFRGQELGEHNIAEREGLRDLVTALRDRGERTGGPRPLTPNDRRAFTDALARTLDRLTRPRRVPPARGESEA